MRAWPKGNAGVLGGATPGSTSNDLPSALATPGGGAGAGVLGGGIDSRGRPGVFGGAIDIIAGVAGGATNPSRAKLCGNAGVRGGATHAACWAEGAGVLGGATGSSCANPGAGVWGGATESVLAALAFTAGVFGGAGAKAALSASCTFPEVATAALAGGGAPRGLCGPRVNCRADAAEPAASTASTRPVAFDRPELLLLNAGVHGCAAATPAGIATSSAAM